MTASKFRADTDYNPYLPAGHGHLVAAITMTAPADLTRTTGRAEVVIIDESRSMSLAGGRKMAAAKAAAAAAIDCLDDGVAFAVVAGNHEARQVWPPEPGVLAVASSVQRARARQAIDEIEPSGMTAMGRWLDLARRLLEPAEAGLRHAILLSDGHDTESGADRLLREATEACRGVFTCDCRGVGTDWKVEDLRYVADTLLGQEGMVRSLDDIEGRDRLVEDFRSLIQASQARTTPDLRLRIMTRDMSDVGRVDEDGLRSVELVDRAEVTHDGHRAVEIGLSPWGPDEVRTYFVELEVRPEQIGTVGDYKRIAMVQLVGADGTVAASSTIEVRWTDDVARITRAAPTVTRHGQHQALARATQEGVAALGRGDEATAVRELGRAVRLADELRDPAHAARLAELVRVDPATGEVELLGASRADIMEADTYSTRVRTHRRSEDG